MHMMKAKSTIATVIVILLLSAMSFFPISGMSASASQKSSVFSVIMGMAVSMSALLIVFSVAKSKAKQGQAPKNP